MKTSEVLIYGAIIFLLYKVYKNTQPGVNLDFNNPGTKSKKINLPPFAIVTPTYWDKKQIQPTPAEVLNPEQLAYFKSKNKSLLKQIHTC
jgi:hypothetical protein